MLFLDITYLLCCNFYKKREGDIYKILGMILLSGVFLFNTFFLGLLISRQLDSDTQLQWYKYRIIVVLGSLLFFGFLFYLRYFKITTYDQVYDRYHALSDSKRKTYHIVAFIYIISSFAAPILFAVINASAKK